MIKKITITAEPCEGGDFFLTITEESTNETPALKADVIWLLGQAIKVVQNSADTNPHHING